MNETFLYSRWLARITSFGLKVLVGVAHRKQLPIAQQKTRVTPFTSDTHQSWFHIHEQDGDEVARLKGTLESWASRGTSISLLALTSAVQWRGYQWLVESSKNSRQRLYSGCALPLYVLFSTTLPPFSNPYCLPHTMTN